MAEEHGIVDQLEGAVAVEVPETQQGALLSIEGDLDQTAPGCRGETDAATLQTGHVRVGSVPLPVIDLAGRRPGAFPAALHQGQEAEEGLLPVRGQGQRIVGDLVVQQVGTQGRPSDQLVRDLDRGARGLQEHAYAADGRIDFGKNILGLAPCRQQGEGCRPEKETFHIQFLRFDTIRVGKT